jgi:hypothetical protein
VCVCLCVQLAICCRQLQSKEQALRILKQELDLSRETVDHSRQEIAQLRSQLARSSSAPSEDVIQEREQFVAQLEASQERIAELERQLQMEEDEKEEVLGQRDYFSSQCSALKKCLEEKKNEQPPSQCALQTLAEENRELKLKLVEVQAERDQANARIDRYKRAVERRKAQEDKEQPSTAAGRHNNLRQALRRVTELETLANCLSETVKEKSIALTHQKKANKILGARVADLEHRLKVLEISGLWSASSSSGPVLDLAWNEDTKNGMELMTPHRDPHLPTSSPPHSSLAHYSPPPPHRPHSSEQDLQLTPLPPPLSSSTTDSHREHQDGQVSPNNQPERMKEGEKTSVEGTPVVFA